LLSSGKNAQDWLASAGRSRRLFVCLCIAAALLGLGVMIFSDGYRYGLYSDDWPHKLWAYDVQTDQWRPHLRVHQPYLRPVGQVLAFNLANALPDQELFVRLLWAAVHLSNVCLAASLAYRLTRSSLALVAAGAVMLCPVPAHEAIFWHSGAASALLGTLVALAAMHLLLTALATDGKWRIYRLLGLAAVGLIPLFYEQPAACVLVLPVLALAQVPLSRRRLGRALLALAAAGGVLFLYWLLILRHTPALALRGGLNLSPAYLSLERAPVILREVAWMVFGRYGWPGYKTIWTLGLQRALGATLAAVALLLLAAGTALSLRLASRWEDERPPEGRSVLVLLAAGCLWIASGFVPVLIMQQQIVESRLLYYPWVGVAFVLAAAVALAWPRDRRRLSWVLALALAALFVAQLPAMAGFGQVYKLRYEEDQRQLAALAAAVPTLPAGHVFLLPLVNDEGFAPLTARENEIVEPVLLGVFEADYVAKSAAQLLYHRRGRDIEAVTRSNWRPLSFGGVEGEGAETVLLINGRAVRADQCLAFSCRQGGVLLHDRLIAELAGGRQVVVELPLARQAGAPGAALEPLTLSVEPD